MTEPERFAELVARHHTVVHRYAARRLGTELADDIASETFTVAFARRDRFDLGYADARPWLLGIATNLIRRHARDEARGLRAYASTGDDRVAPGADEGARTMGTAVAAAMQALRPKYRDVLFLHAVVELSHDEIARALAVPVGTVKGRLHRARTIAAKELAARGIPPPSTPAVTTHEAAES